MKKLILIKILMLMLSFAVSGQKKVKLFFDQSDIDKSILILNNQEIDSAQFSDFLNTMYQQLYQQGFLSASIDSEKIGVDSIAIHIREGEAFTLGYLSPGNLPLEVQQRVDYRDRFFSNKKFNYKQLANLLENILRYSDNNGYPFSTVRLDSIQRDGSTINAAINYNQGPLITFDSLKISGNVKTKKTFLQSYLRIFPGHPFESRRIDEAPSKLSRLPFLTIADDPFLTFQNNQSTYHLDLAYRKVNLVDGIIGFLPNETEGSELLITGQFDLQLYDLFASGKTLQLNWKRLKVESQSLEAKYAHPYLFKSPVSFDVGFSLLKEDTTFLNRVFDLNLAYDAGKHSTYHAFVKDKTSNTLSDESPALSQLDVLDFDITTYGAGFQWNNLNDFVDPTKGLNIILNGQLGNKTLKRNPAIDDEVYDSLPLKTLQYQLDLEVNWFMPVGQRWVFNPEFRAGKIVNDIILNNDMYRIGGLRTLRGFNENFFFTPGYGLINLNWKYYFDEASHFLFFIDQGIMETARNNVEKYDYPTGLGVGINFSTPNGLFSFIYALGRNNDQDFTVSLSKIHFGYSSRF